MLTTLNEQFVSTNEVMLLKDADGKVNSVEPDETSPSSTELSAQIFRILRYKETEPCLGDFIINVNEYVRSSISVISTFAPSQGVISFRNEMFLLKQTLVLKCRFHFERCLVTRKANSKSQKLLHFEKKNAEKRILSYLPRIFFSGLSVVVQLFCTHFLKW